MENQDLKETELVFKEREILLKEVELGVLDKNEYLNRYRASNKLNLLDFVAKSLNANYIQEGFSELLEVAFVLGKLTNAKEIEVPFEHMSDSAMGIFEIFNDFYSNNEFENKCDDNYSYISCYARTILLQKYGVKE